jgi:hypothetical protein
MSRICNKYELKIGEKNDEEERQCRVGNDDSQENAYGRNDILHTQRTIGRTGIINAREAQLHATAVHSTAEDAAHDGAVEDAAVLRRDVH